MTNIGLKIVFDNIFNPISNKIAYLYYYKATLFINWLLLLRNRFCKKKENPSFLVD